MRIAFIAPEFVTEEYFSGGLANYVHRVSKALSKFGHEVHVIILSRQRTDTFKHGDVFIHPIMVNDRNPIVKYILKRFLYDVGQWLAFSYKAWRKSSMLNREKPLDIIQVSNYRACGLFVCAFSRIPFVTRISSFQKALNIASDQRRHFGVIATEWLELAQLRLCKNIFAPSQALATMLQDKAGISGVTVIPTPFYFENETIDLSLYKKLKGKKYLLYFGRYDVHKGIKVLAKALPKVFDRLPECHAVFVGRDNKAKSESSARKHISTLCSTQTNRLSFYDQTTHDSLYPVISGAHLIVLPSIVDNLPNALLESMAFGKPVIGTAGASFDEVIIDGQNGFLAPNGNSNALADTIIRAWNSPSLVNIGLEASKTARQFDREITISKLLKYYEKVIHDKRL